MEEAIRLSKINQAQDNISLKFSYIRKLVVYLEKIQELDNIKQEFQDQDHITIKMQYLNMEVKMNRAMDLE